MKKGKNKTLVVKLKTSGNYKKIKHTYIMDKFNFY